MSSSGYGQVNPDLLFFSLHFFPVHSFLLSCNKSPQRGSSADQGCVVQAVEDYIQAQQAGDVEAATAMLHTHAHAHVSQPMSAPGVAAAPVHIVSSGSFRASQSIAHGSYQEAFVSSLRSRGFSFEG